MVTDFSTQPYYLFICCECDLELSLAHILRPGRTMFGTSARDIPCSLLPALGPIPGCYIYARFIHTYASHAQSKTDNELELL